MKVETDTDRTSCEISDSVCRALQNWSYWVFFSVISLSKILLSIRVGMLILTIYVRANKGKTAKWSIIRCQYWYLGIIWSCVLMWTKIVNLMHTLNRDRGYK